MKMTAYLIAALLLSLLLPSSARAIDCTITNTGPGSTNECSSDDSTTCTTTNSNQVDVDTTNPQDSESGNTETGGNTTGGNATSGTSGNSSSTNVDVTVDNNGCGDPASTTTPPSGGQGGGQVNGTSTTAAAQVVAPVGGVGAGTGGLALPALTVSILCAAAGVYRLRKLVYA